MKAPFGKFGTIQRSYCNEQQIPIKPYEMNGNLNIGDINNKEYCVVVLEGVDEVLETVRIEEEKPIDDEIQPIKTFFEFESATDFKGFEALHNIVLNIINQMLCSDVQTEVGHMYDELRQSFETF